MITTTPANWTYTAQRGYFTHDTDPANWTFRATTQPNLGLLSIEYPTDIQFDPSRQKSQWQRFTHYLNTLNLAGPTHKRYKLLYLIRHGQGTHNVKETEVGREEWNSHWAKLSSDGMTVWEDAELTAAGEQQAKDIATFFAKGDVPGPERIYSSPLRRCLRTTELAYPSSMTSNPPIIKENLRERLGVHTCDKRSTKTWITDTFPDFVVEMGFTEEDELWRADVRESLEEHIVRVRKLLDEIFDDQEGEQGGDAIMSLTAHSGAIMTLFRAMGWGRVPVAAGAVYPLLVCAEKEK
ncbi:phosphoglycerate mutase-like protein [Massarina eburnea CBS 473.64]|uniref:Phosphoglycerate mutase-like protein n=1 Tax=Massarina eburnea CBS 473.64 TaxID=1395130 RepID=A0A6A6S5J4_9PLEO|nr:phosphoglycerate mutase-like protein [Massarina eburnea CBS 473.64]